MKRNLLLIGAVVLALLVIVNSVKRLSGLRNTSQKVGETEQRLEVLRRENESLKKELEYKKSDQFVEGEIRDKLGMVKSGEALVILPNKNGEQSTVNSEQSTQIPNYIKWWNLFFRS